MTQIQKIAEEIIPGNDETLNSALKKMKKVHDHELHFYLVLRDTLQSTSPNTRQAITLAQVESERRTKSQVRNLAYITTGISGAVGLAGVVLGFCLSQIFSN
jgi:ElaB/YqjD/DUF883 family membrane-anchored ribosome-binding protein